ncbi:hypothetical protein MACK_003253 [Theileria orientalis]|uniref:Uncharacterized protein n=1 Tax=Theileria orientalis TaxID=68886 RepID=A0A976XHI6_THEOR|nr:hypothetical protein MACK_003253 [Theileria orientalis]
MMLFYSFGLLTILLTKISYTLDIKYYSDRLYHDIAKNFTNKSSESADTQIHVLNPKYVKRVELILRKKYGGRNMLKEFQERELNNYNSQPLFDSALRDHVNEHFDDKYVREFHRLDDSSDNSEELITARIIVKLIKHEFEKFNLIRDQYITPNMERFTQIRHLSQDLHLYTDTPCSTQAGCDKLEMLMNLCSYIRGGTSFAYDIFATMVHVLGNMLSVLCGCIFVGPAQVCLLKNFPYTCRIPYPAFSQLFQSTYGVWELVKITTNLCRVYGDIGFGSKFG